MPDTLYLEPDSFSPDTVKLLETYGYKTFGNRGWSDGECIMVDPKTGERLGASDGRYLRSGAAIGY